MGRWAEKIKGVEAAKESAAAQAEREREVLVAEWEGKLAHERAEAEARVAQSRVDMEAELVVTRSTAATEASGLREALQAADGGHTRMHACNPHTGSSVLPLFHRRG